jgi:biopolymer transport protein ExbD
MSPKALAVVGAAMIMVAVLVFWMTAYWLEDPSFEFISIPILLACMAVVVAGGGAILRALIIWLSGILHRQDPLRIFPEMVLRNVIPLWRHQPMPLIRILPDFRTAWFCIIGVLSALFCIFVSRPGWPQHGLLVDFKEERAVGVEKSPWTETMVVYVDAKRAFFVNGKAVAREELRSRLLEELTHRGLWVVYFEAAGNCLYTDAVYAIDAIQGLGAKLIWITPKTREEWKKRGVS